MILDALASLLLQTVVVLGLGWPLASRLSCDPAEKLTASVAVSLIGVYLIAWLIYVLRLPIGGLWIVPALALGGMALNGREFLSAIRGAEVRTLLISQAIVTAWCVAWLGLVVSYSGGGWYADWFGHWQRATFFLGQGPRDVLFNGFDPVTSRPPLANVVIGAFMVLTRNDFPHYQLATTFFGSLVFLPAALLARRFGGRPVSAILAVLFVLNPMFVQNATFAWTKLPAAFFTLAAVYYFLRRRDDGSPAAGILCALTLAAAILTHYSAGPYAIVLAVAWLAAGRGEHFDHRWWRRTLAAAVAGLALLLTWFGWAVAVYGIRGTFLTNTSVTDKAPTAAGQVKAVLLNLRDSIVPHFLRDVDPSLIAQTSPWGWWRDWFFQLYQVNVIFAFGSVAAVVILIALVRRARTADPLNRIGWTSAIVVVAILGIAVHGARDTWGLAHICLQPLVLCGLAFLAGEWNSLSPTWRRVAVAGAAVDLVCGILLQFGAESFLLDQWLTPGRDPTQTVASYARAAELNLRAKFQGKWTFFGDGYADQDLVILALLAVLLVVALRRASHRATGKDSRAQTIVLHR